MYDYLKITDEQQEAISSIKHTNPITPEIIAEAHKVGLIPLEKLQNGCYYWGMCRNASVAKWDKEKNCFWYMRHKFGDTFREAINHFENDDGYDVFIPIKFLTEEIK